MGIHWTLDTSTYTIGLDLGDPTVQFPASWPKTSSAFSVGRCRRSNMPKAQPMTCMELHGRSICCYLLLLVAARPHPRPILSLTFPWLINFEAVAGEGGEDLCLQSRGEADLGYLKMVTPNLIW